MGRFHDFTSFLVFYLQKKVVLPEKTVKLSK